MGQEVVDGVTGGVGGGGDHVQAAALHHLVEEGVTGDGSSVTCNTEKVMLTSLASARWKLGSNAWTTRWRTAPSLDTGCQLQLAD